MEQFKDTNIIVEITEETFIKEPSKINASDVQYQITQQEFNQFFYPCSLQLEIIK